MRKLKKKTIIKYLLTYPIFITLAHIGPNNHLIKLPDRILQSNSTGPEPNKLFRCDPKTEFPCNGTETCILKSWICDGRVSKNICIINYFLH